MKNPNAQPKTYYRCHACGYPAAITDTGVDEMRAHLRTHQGDRTIKPRDVYVEGRVR